MATVTSITAAKAQEIEDDLIVSGEVVGEDIVLTKNDASTITIEGVVGVAAATKHVIAWSISSPDGIEGISTGAGIAKWIAPFACTILSARVANGAGVVTGDLIVDVNKNGTTIFTTQANRPKVTSGNANGVGASATPDVTSLVAGDRLTVDLDAVNAADDEADDLYTVFVIVEEA